MLTLADTDRVIARTLDLPSAKVDDGLMLIDRRGGFCYALNPTGARIWDILANPKPVSSICESLSQEFRVSEEQCLLEVMEVLSRMHDAGLLRVN